VLHLLSLVLLVGVVDSLNPSTVAPALYLAGGRQPLRGLLGFIVGVFVVNLLGGLALALGPGQAILALAPHPGFEVRRLLELALGLATFIVAIGLWLARDRLERRVSGNQDRIDGSSLLVGAAITAAELPTAVPYFAVIAAVVGSGRAVGTQVVLLVVFNATFVAPLVAIFLLEALSGARGRERIVSLRARLDRHLAQVIPAVVLVVAVVLTARGSVGLLRH
jgi:cytochrome c biogenesis protein CcdA